MSFRDTNKIVLPLYTDRLTVLLFPVFVLSEANQLLVVASYLVDWRESGIDCHPPEMSSEHLTYPHPAFQNGLQNLFFSDRAEQLDIELNISVPFLFLTLSPFVSSFY